MFVHLRLHTEFSVVDGTNRIDEVVAAAAANGQPALAITDLNNLFGAVKFYKAARGAGVKPLLGAEVMLQGFAEDTPGAMPGSHQPAAPRVVLLVQDTAGLPEPERAAGPRLDAQRWPRRRGDAARVADRTQRRPDFAGRRASRPGGSGADAGRPATRSRPRLAARQRVPAPLLHRAAARRPRRRRAPCAGGGATGRAAEAAGGGHAPGAVPGSKTTTRPTRRAFALPTAKFWATGAACAGSPASSISRAQSRWRRCLPTCPRRLPTRWRSPGAAT